MGSNRMNSKSEIVKFISSLEAGSYTEPQKAMLEKIRLEDLQQIHARLNDFYQAATMTENPTDQDRINLRDAVIELGEQLGSLAGKFDGLKDQCDQLLNQYENKNKGLDCDNTKLAFLRVQADTAAELANNIPLSDLKSKTPQEILLKKTLESARQNIDEKLDESPLDYVMKSRAIGKSTVAKGLLEIYGKDLIEKEQKVIRFDLAQLSNPNKYPNASRELEDAMREGRKIKFTLTDRVSEIKSPIKFTQLAARSLFRQGNSDNLTASPNARAVEDSQKSFVEICEKLNKDEINTESYRSSAETLFNDKLPESKSSSRSSMR